MFPKYILQAVIKHGAAYHVHHGVIQLYWAEARLGAENGELGLQFTAK